MKNLNLIETAAHNRQAINKSFRNITVLILVCAIPAAICRLFFWEYTRRALVTSWRYKRFTVRNRRWVACNHIYVG